MKASLKPRVVGLCLVTLGLSLTSACGDDATNGSDGAQADPTVPSCMKTMTAVTIPKGAGFPSDWPFPPGTVVSATEEVPGGGLAVTAQVPSEFTVVLPFMQKDVESAGFVATNGEAEEDDAEATWSGNGYSGTWAIRGSDTCEGTTLLQVAATKS